MNTKLKKLVRQYCPNIAPLRNWMAEQKLKEYREHFMDVATVADCEKNPRNREKAIRAYCESHPKYSAKIIKDYETYMERVPDTSKRPHMEELRIDVLFTCFAYGFAPDEYFAFRLEGRTLEERKSFMSDQERYLMVYQMNDVIDMDVFLDKYRTYEKYAKYYKREAICVEGQKDKKAFLEFVDRHPVFVQKNVALSKGDSVTLVDIRDVGINPGEYFDSVIMYGKHIAEEKVVQSDEMARLNPSSVNTIRCMTFLDKGEVQIGPCFLKVGQGNSFVDNAGAGGIVCGLDSHTGTVITSGFDEFLNEYSEHPETHVRFLDFQLPEWNEMIELTKKMAKESPSVRYIGWDMAHTDNGWVIIEGNGSGQMIIPQIVFQRGFKQEVQNLTGGGTTE